MKASWKEHPKSEDGNLSGFAFNVEDGQRTETVFIDYDDASNTGRVLEMCALAVNKLAKHGT